MLDLVRFYTNADFDCEYVQKESRYFKIEKTGDRELFLPAFDEKSTAN